MATQPDQQQQTEFRTTPVTLGAAAAQQVVPSNQGRKYLMIQNTGTNPVTLGFGAGNPVAGLGLTLDGASGANGQGGVYEALEVIPTNEIRAISTGGTTLAVIEG